MKVPFASNTDQAHKEVVTTVGKTGNGASVSHIIAWGALGKNSNVRQIDVLGKPFRPSSIVKSVAILTFKFVGTTGTEVVVTSCLRGS